MGVFDSPISNTVQFGNYQTFNAPSAIQSLGTTTRNIALGPGQQYIPGVGAVGGASVGGDLSQPYLNYGPIRVAGNSYVADWTKPGLGAQVINGLIVGPVMTGSTSLGPTSTTVGNLLYSQVHPNSINAAAAAQQQYINKSYGDIAAYANPNTYFKPTSYQTTVKSPNLAAPITASYQAGAKAYGDYGTQIQNTINKYANAENLYPDEQALNAQMLAAFNQARGRYNQVTIGSQAEGVTDLQQLYTNARDQFNPYTQLGQSSANMLEELSGVRGNAAQQAAIQTALDSPEIQQQLNMGSQAIGKLASSSGYLRSGRVMQELQQLGQQLAGNAIAQKRADLMSQVGIGSQAAQQVAGLYQGQNQAEMARAGSLAALDTQANERAFAQRQAIEAQNLAERQRAQEAELSALGMDQARASGLANLLAQQGVQESAAQQQQYQNEAAEAKYNYETNLAAEKLKFQDQVRAQQQYLQLLLNLNSAQGNVAAQQQYNLGQSVVNYQYM